MNKVYIALYENGLGESIRNGITSVLKDGFTWIGDKVIQSLGNGLIGLTPVFAGTCIIGVFLTIAGAVSYTHLTLPTT